MICFQVDYRGSDLDSVWDSLVIECRRLQRGFCNSIGEIGGRFDLGKWTWEGGEDINRGDSIF